jgi:6,7-dimethyl-8-ribityllumazine synthase|tara:strand:+ start:98 stop:520 length:423 start_codon:yes stop_codon:yes gene_type:complete
MNKILVVQTAWYEEETVDMSNIVINILENNELDKTTQVITATAPGALELAAVAKHHIVKHDDYIGIIFNGIVKRGETIHYELVTNETFRSIGSLAENFCNIAIINNVICVENLAQLEKRLVKNTENNTYALIELINEKSS